MLVVCNIESHYYTIILQYIILLFFISFISESPRWLLSRGRTKEAIEILEKMARFNGKIVHISPDDIIMKDFHRASFKDFITDMVKCKRLMCRLSVVSFNWYVQECIITLWKTIE